MACVRFDVETMPYKYRDLFSMMYYGTGAWKTATAEDIEDYFTEYELEITADDHDALKLYQPNN